MHRIDGPGHVGGAFVSEDLALGRPPTVVTPEWLNAVQSELVAAIGIRGGEQPNKGDNGQLARAILATMGSLSGTALNPASGPLSAAYVGKLVFVDLAVRTSVQLPNDPSIAVGSVFSIAGGSSSGTFTVAPPAGGYIAYGSTSMGVNTPITVRADETVILAKASDTVYSVLSGGASGSPSQAASLNGNGWQRLPSGLIIQWLNAYPITQTYATLNLPIAFPSACRAAFAVHSNATVSNSATVDVGALTSATVQVKTSAAFAVGVYVFALGH